MGKKKRSDAGVDEPTKSRLPLIIAGIAVLIVAVAVGSFIGTVFLVDSDSDAADFELPAMIGEPPQLERSSVADLLTSRSIEDLTPAERNAVKAEAVRVYADAQFRVKNPAYLGVDVVRKAGSTVASRQYSLEEAPGGAAFTETVSFFCTDDDGAIVRYRAVRNAGGTTNTDVPLQDGQQAMERLLDDLDWREAKDLGLREINGRQTRGAELTFYATADAGYRTEIWLDIENARVWRYLQYGDQGNESFYTNYEFDWRTPPRIEPLPDQIAPCADQVYD